MAGGGLMSRHVVARVDEIPPGGRKIVELDGHSVGVFNVGGTYHAMLNRCPHAGAPLCEGQIFGLAEADMPGTEVRYERRGEFLRCPWHQWEFDITTGRSWFDPRRLRVRTYDVEVAWGTPEDCVDPAGGRQEGPLIVEGYDTGVEGEFVVVDTSRRRPQRSASTVTAEA
jgi:nitrite reductase/ring-hydroxylating ferredoxin subunit